MVVFDADIGRDWVPTRENPVEKTEKPMMITYQEFKQKIETEFRFLHDEQGKEFLDFLAGQFSNYKAIVKKREVSMARPERLL